MYGISGPVVSALANKFGCRFVSIMGSVVAFTALLLSTVAPNVEVLMLTYGVMGMKLINFYSKSIIIESFL